MQKQYTITSEEGLHARPCTLIVTAATPFHSDVQIKYGEREANLKSIMGVMALGIPSGAMITIIANGDDAAAAIEKVGAVITTEAIGAEV